MSEEKKDRKTLKEAADAARVELAGKRRELAKAEEVRMLRAPAAAKGGAR
jgi:hypothetical protein